MRIAIPNFPVAKTTALFAFLAAIFTGCSTRPMAEENEARDRLTETGSAVSQGRNQTGLHTLSPDSAPEDFVRFALLNNPAVEAAWQDWRASVSTITTARAMPDPMLTFEADIADEIMTTMPGVMFNFANPGARKAMGSEAVAESEVAYRNYLAQLQQTAATVRNAWVDLAYANETVDLHAAMLEALDEASELAATEYVTGRGMSSLESQVRLRSASGMHHAEHHATIELRDAARWQFKSALGLSPDATDPPWPDAVLKPTPLPSRDALWQQIIANNPDLAVLRSMVDQSVAAETVADRSRSPEFSIGAMVDLLASPLMVRPTGSISLPIWRDKIDAQIETARARHDAAAARISARELTLAAELAQAFYVVQNADLIVAYIDRVALPNLDTVSQTAEAAFQSGMSGGAVVAETEAMSLELKVRRLEMLHHREMAVTDLFLLIGTAAPADALQLSTNSP